MVKADVHGPQAEPLGTDSRSGLASFDHHRSPKVSRALFGEALGSDTQRLQHMVGNTQLRSAHVL